MRTAIENLDHVLYYFKINPFYMRPSGMTDNHYFEGIDYDLLTMITEKLADDGYLIRSVIKTTRNVQYTTGDKIEEVTFSDYKISFDGMLFYEQGGYKEELKRKQLELKSLETDVRLRKRNEIWTLRGTWVAAIGVLIAAAYYIEELGKFFCWW